MSTPIGLDSFCNQLTRAGYSVATGANDSEFVVTRGTTRIVAHFDYDRCHHGTLVDLKRDGKPVEIADLVAA